MNKPRVGEAIGPFEFPLVAEDGTVTFGGAAERWTVLFVYRGKHCPRCKRYLSKLNDALDTWEALMDVVVVSADTKDKAAADQDAFEWRFKLACGLSEDQMRRLGLYVSDPISDAETDRRFAEPGMFALKPDGTLMLVDISNGPASRPDLDELLDGLQFNIENDRPTRGLA